VSNLRDAEATVRHAPTNGAAVGRGLGWIRNREEYRGGGFRSWEEYVEQSLGVPVPLAEAAIDAYEEWSRAAFVADREARAWLMRTIAAVPNITDIRDAEMKVARDSCLPVKVSPPAVWPEVAVACASLETTFEHDEEEAPSASEGAF
jgi:hypothetical protein